MRARARGGRGLARIGRALAAGFGAVLLASCRPCPHHLLVPLTVFVETTAHVAITDAVVTCASSSEDAPPPLPSGAYYPSLVAFPDEIRVTATWRGARLDRRVFVDETDDNPRCPSPDAREIRLVFSSELSP